MTDEEIKRIRDDIRKNTPPLTQNDVLFVMNDLACKGWTVLVFRNKLGTMTAMARRGRKEIDTDGMHGVGTEPAILALWDKVHGTGPYKKT